MEGVSVAGAKRRAVVLLSGGLDSATAAAVAKSKGYELFAISFDYGQRHRRELVCARKVGKALGVTEHRMIFVGLSELGGSALTDKKIKVPGGIGDWKGTTKIPVTYVPARNLIFLALAAAYAETVGAEALYIGANAVDFSGYPDCRPEFLRAFERALRSGTKRCAEGGKLVVKAPLLHMTKSAIVRLGCRLGVPHGKTWSCYCGGDEPCGECDSCRIRAKGFREAGMDDPLVMNAARGGRSANAAQAGSEEGAPTGHSRRSGKCNAPRGEGRRPARRNRSKRTGA
jgi:7-cyano-7-deazaguanine synthase